MTAASLACTCGLVSKAASFSAAMSGFAALWPAVPLGPGLRGVSFIQSQPSSQGVASSKGVAMALREYPVGAPIVYARKATPSTTPIGRHGGGTGLHDKMKQKFIANNKKPGKSNASTNPDRKIEGNPDVNNQQFRTKSKIKLLNLYTQKPDL